jgi:hypothetical protein
MFQRKILSDKAGDREAPLLGDRAGQVKVLDRREARVHSLAPSEPDGIDFLDDESFC